MACSDLETRTPSYCPECCAECFQSYQSQYSTQGDVVPVSLMLKLSRFNTAGY